mgnify:CR=1 FL=1
MKTALPESVPSDKVETTTVWSFPERGKWSTHSAKYRGNCAPQIARNLILLYSQEGDTVLDPMVGSGTTMIEAKLLGRKNDWFGKKEYKDVLEFVRLVGCYYFFHEIPLDFLGLPQPWD